MNPREFGWDRDQQITVKNPTKNDFKFQVNSKYYQVNAGKSAKMPGFIAWTYVYKISQQMALEAGDFQHWNDINVRKRYFSNVVVDKGQLIQSVDEQPEPEPEFETFETEPEGSNDKEIERNKDASHDEEKPAGVNTVADKEKVTAKTTIKPMRATKKVAKKA